MIVLAIYLLALKLYLAIYRRKPNDAGGGMRAAIRGQQVVFSCGGFLRT